jgi:hypothetical protein
MAGKLTGIVREEGSKKRKRRCKMVWSLLFSGKRSPFTVVGGKAVECLRSRKKEGTTPFVMAVLTVFLVLAM